MSQLPLSAILGSHKRSGVPLSLSLRGGHYRQVEVRSVGDSWFSAQETGDSGVELVITFSAVSVLRRISSLDEEGHFPASLTPLAAMLAQLQRQRTTVIFHLEDLDLVGCVTMVGSDCLQVSSRNGNVVLVPVGRLLWLEACG